MSCHNNLPQSKRADAVDKPIAFGCDVKLEVDEGVFYAITT
jgi:hypothetical protein